MKTGTTNDSLTHDTVRVPRLLMPTRASRSGGRRTTVRKVTPSPLYIEPAVHQALSERPVGQVRHSPGVGHPGRIYTCDAANHRIDVTDESLRPLFSFGTYGSGPGQFKQPTDVVLVPLGATDAAPGEAPLALVVADRDNHRLQLFELDGAFIASIDPWLGRARHVNWVSRAGWPFFRVNPIPQMVLPSRLEWHHPRLDVMSPDGQVVSLDLHLALLPEFEAWLAMASRTVAKAALNHFRTRPPGCEIPESHLQAITAKVRVGLTLVAAARG